MAHSYVTYRDASRIVHDAHVEIFVIALLAELRDEEPYNWKEKDAIRRFLFAWKEVIDSYPPGCIGIGIDDFLLTNEDICRFYELTRRAWTRFRSFADDDGTIDFYAASRSADVQNICFYDRIKAGDVDKAFEQILSLLPRDPPSVTA